MIYEPAQPMADGPIEQYLDLARERLLLRHDLETVEVLLAEFHAHLVESACEVAALGIRKDDAERRAIELFGGKGIEPLASSLAARQCAGDRTWGRLALVWGVFIVFGLCVATVYVDALTNWPLEVLRASFIGSLLVYGYACLKAKRYAMGRHLAAGGSLVLAAFAMLGQTDDALSIQRDTGRGTFLLAANTNTIWPKIQAGDPVRVASSEGTSQGLLDAIRKSAIEEASRDSLGDRTDGRQTADGLPGSESVKAGAWAVGPVPFRPMPSFAALDSMIPSRLRLGTIWLVFALITRALAQWLTRFAGARDTGGLHLT